MPSQLTFIEREKISKDITVAIFQSVPGRNCPRFGTLAGHDFS